MRQLRLGPAHPRLGQSAGQRVSARSLQGYPRGQSVGIPNLPDPLPDRWAIKAMPWSACSLRRSAGSADLATHVFVGSEPAGGESLADRALLVELRAENSHAVSGRGRQSGSGSPRPAGRRSAWPRPGRPR